jgi:hypothetical protein
MDVALDVSAGRRRVVSRDACRVILIEYRPGSQEEQSGDGLSTHARDRRSAGDRVAGGRRRAPPVQGISPEEATLPT